MSTRNRIYLGVALAVIFALATALYWTYYVGSDSYNTARDYAGDRLLPGASWFPEASETSALAAELDTSSRAAFHRLLDLDRGLILLVLAFMLSVAFLGRQRPTARRWALALAASAILAAASDWTENALLREAFTQGIDPGEPARWAALATAAKWTLLAVSAVLALLTLFFMFGPARDWAQALFMDVPYLIDSASRRSDFRLHSEYDHDPERGELTARPVWQKPVVWFFAVLVAFTSYGPTADGLCTVVLAGGAYSLLAIGGGGLLFGLIPAGLWIYRGILERMQRREKRGGARALSATERRPIVWALMVPCAIVLLMPVIAAGIAMLYAAEARPCAGARFDATSAWRLALCVGAIAAFAFASARIEKTRWLIWIQAAIVTTLTLIQWFWLADPGATEASGLPYRHVFGVLIPAMCLMLCLAPFVARRRFAKAKASAGSHFVGELSKEELFNRDRSEPELSFGLVVNAIVKGAVYHPLQLLLPPSLLALVAPADWLASFMVLGLAVSLLLLTWGRISTRWEQLVAQVERWLLSGLAFPVSLFVITLGVLRVLGVQYVSTILDAAPFGAVFAAVFMSYTLSWVVEYWNNRAAAAELLSMLGAKDDAIKAAYAPGFNPAPEIGIDRAGRHLMSHGIGRILVVGKSVKTEKDAKPETGFHTYNLLGVFSALEKGPDRWRLLAINRSTNLYFHAMNALVIVALSGLAVAYVALGGTESAEAVVEANARADGSARKDLAASLVATPGNARPAVVIAASGGGTRAALYAAHVLQGLHRVGADRDIVLLSGVSGGGVALAYFAAHYETLIADGGPDEWLAFRDGVSKPFIQDVIEGAAEWRIFGATPLTNLLAESFERRLLAGAKEKTLALAGAPALILNTTIVGHPLEDSELLTKALNAAPRTALEGCREQQRPYNVMSGGRLIFTNLGSTAEFPGAGTIPDMRLPYRIVRDPSVSLASAAALNANFPPAFQNARVTIKGFRQDADCPDRAYYVTDGGAEENLGLVSALLAVQSALKEIETRCREKAACPRALRPIHFVLAEASAATFDYQQDRGVSAALGGAKERMTGGLTNELIGNVGRLLRDIAGENEATQLLRFHYLPLPLAFRARGGFGTHWMHADRIEMSDPRLRAEPGRWERLVARATNSSIALDRKEVCELWSALHDPDRKFCGPERRFAGSGAKDVQRWICGSRNEQRGPRDWHIEAWQSLVKDLRTGTEKPFESSCEFGRR